MRTLLLAACLPQIHGCISPTQGFDQLARRSGLQPSTVRGTAFEHRIYRTTTEPQTDGLLFVYIDGDGRPGTAGGRLPSTDPTTRHPLALQLMATASGAGIYLTRPCYNNPNRPGPCTSALWTTARYSDEVVASLSAALGHYMAERTDVGIVLVGYSGGGTLAMLMAPHVRNLRAVVTVAANLDIDAWTSLHGYLPLHESVNPARLPDPPVPVMHFVGGRDTNVPPAMLADYFSQHRSAAVRQVANFDHRCCWVEQWPALLHSALERIPLRGFSPPAPAAP